MSAGVRSGATELSSLGGDGSGYPLSFRSGVGCQPLPKVSTQPHHSGFCHNLTGYRPSAFAVLFAKLLFEWPLDYARYVLEEGD